MTDANFSGDPDATQPPTHPDPGQTLPSGAEVAQYAATLPPSSPLEQDLSNSDPPADGSTVTSASRPASGVLTAADTPPGYVVVRELGRGGMGVVYLARQDRLNRLVAIKMVLGGAHAGTHELTRFLHEAESIAQLHHPNIVAVYEVGAHDGRPFFTLEYCEGGSLDRKLAGNPLPPREAAELLVTLARAIAHAHAAGVVHRDLKPQNVLLAADGSPKVTDFGLAKRTGSGSDLTATGAVMGTPSYMAPEQAQGAKAAGPPADVYSLGAILYECLTSRPPFRAATAVDTILQVLSDDPAPPRQLNPQVPADLETICLKCLQKHPGRRYASADALADDLRRWLDGEPIAARPPTRTELARRWVRKHPVRSVAITAAALLAGVVVWFNEQKYETQRQQLAVVAAAERDAQQSAAEARAAAEAARQQKAAADAARETANDEKRNAQAARDEAVDRAYATGIDLAFREWRENNTFRAEQLLNDTPADRRGWEWRFLKALTRTDARVFRGHAGGVYGLAVTPDGSRLASVDQTGVLKVWDLATDRDIMSAEGVGGPVQFSPDGKLGVVQANRRLELRDTDTGGLIRYLPQSRTADAVFVDGGKELLTLDLNTGRIKKWSTTEDKPATELPGTAPLIRNYHDNVLFLPKFSPDGRWLAVGRTGTVAENGKVQLWDVAAGKVAYTFQGVPMHVACLAWQPGGPLLAAGFPNGLVILWDVEARKEARRIRAHNGSVDAIAFSADGKRLATGGQDLAARVWDVATGLEAHTFRGNTANIWGLAFTPDSARLVTGSADRSVRIWELADTRHFDGGISPELLSLMPPAASTHHTYSGVGVPLRLALSSDGHSLTAAYYGGHLSVWDLDSHNQPVKEPFQKSLWRILQQIRAIWR